MRRLERGEGGGGEEKTAASEVASMDSYVPFPDQLHRHNWRRKPSTGNRDARRRRPPCTIGMRDKIQAEF